MVIPIGCSWKNRLKIHKQPTDKQSNYTFVLVMAWEAWKLFLRYRIENYYGSRLITLLFLLLSFLRYKLFHLHQVLFSHSSTTLLNSPSRLTPLLDSSLEYIRIQELLTFFIHSLNPRFIPIRVYIPSYKINLFRKYYVIHPRGILTLFYKIIWTSISYSIFLTPTKYKLPYS